MNRIYRKVWNKALGQLVVASELASSDSSGGVVDQRRDTTQATPALLAVALGLVLGLGMSGSAAAQSVQIGGSATCVAFSGKLLEKCLIEGSASAKGSNAVAIGSNSSATAANSVVHDRARRAGVRHERAHRSLEENDHPVEWITPERVLEGKEALNVIMNRLSTMPERTRDVFVLHRFEGMAYAEIARRMGISVSSVEKHIMKALRLLLEIEE